MEIKMEHVFDVDIDIFEEIWNDHDIQKRVIKEVPTIKEREIVEEKWDGDKLTRKVSYVGNIPIPKFAQKVIKPHMLVWTEETIGNKRKHRYDFKMIPKYFASRVRCEGYVQLVPIGNKTKRETRSIVELKLDPITRRLAERYISSQLRRTMDAEYKALSKIIKERK